MNKKLESVLDYVQSVPVIDFQLESALEGATPPPDFVAGRQAVVIGSQITEFSENVPAELRPQIANSFLLAQLAANKSIENGGSTSDWYKKYTEVLISIGWLVEGDLNAVHKAQGTGAQVHHAIIPVIAAALGGAAATTLIIPVLRGLENMNRDKPWITLLNRESRRASANQFQVCYVNAENKRSPKLVLVCFGLEASKSVTQFLFFNFSNTSATLSHSQTDLCIQPEILEGSKHAIQQRVKSYMSNYVSEIEI